MKVCHETVCLALHPLLDYSLISHVTWEKISFAASVFILISIIRLLWRLKEIRHAKFLEQSLKQGKHSTEVIYCCCCCCSCCYI